MRRIEARLQRLEQAAKRRYPAANRHNSFKAILDCLSVMEVRRMHDALMAGDARLPDFKSMVERARARQAQGWTKADRDALNMHDRAKWWPLWEFMKALGPLIDGSYLDTSRLDVVDLTEAEIKQLVEATQNATCANDLVAVADVIGRLRLDGKVMDMATFELLVLRREIAPPPPQLDWEDFLCALKAADDKLIRSGETKSRR